MKFIHTADWHLGKRLNGSLLDTEQREALEALVRVVDDERPDAVVLAGDVFDVPVPPLTALEAWAWFVHAIVAERAVPLVAIPGNHDHPERLALNAQVARRAGLHILHRLERSHEPVRVAGVDLFGVPFHKPAHVRAAFGEVHEGSAAPDPAASYDAAMARLLEPVRAAREPGTPAVLVAHAFVDGAGDEPEAEDAIVVGGAGVVRVATLAGFDYVALGHIHRARTLGGEDGRAVRYSGSLYPYAFDEAGQTKGVDVVEIDGDGVRVRSAPLAVARQVRVLEGRSFAQVLAEAPSVPAERRDDHVLVRVTDEGPIDHAVARLREVYPNALLQQPATWVGTQHAAFDQEATTIGVEEAFRAFYRHVYQAELDPLEETVLREVLEEDEPEAAA